MSPQIFRFKELGITSGRGLLEHAPDREVTRVRREVVAVNRIATISDS